MQRRRVAEATKGVGKPKVGGDFNLMDHEGRPFSSADLKGRYSLVSLVFINLAWDAFGYGVVSTVKGDGAGCGARE
jgi:hypothetical protein